MWQLIKNKENQCWHSSGVFPPHLLTCIFLSSCNLLFSQFSVFMKDSKKIMKTNQISQFRKLSTDEIRESPTGGEAGSKGVLQVLIKTHFQLKRV